MTSAVELCIQALLADPGVALIASSRVFAIAAPQKVTRPAIVVSLVSEDRTMILGGPAQWPDSRVQALCMASTALGAISTGERVIAALEVLSNYNPEPGVYAAFTKTGPDFTNYVDDLSLFARFLDWRIQWRPAP
ncbi:MAG TPA: hypothetical protein VNX29_07105 [Kaistia sp.]|nr:hypothetical protein [Kaistia sp.]